MKRWILFSFVLLSCSTVPKEYVSRVERLEREVDSLRLEIRRLREMARELSDSTKKSEEYYNQIYDYINKEYERRGSPIRPGKAK
jgi:predicted RNase H-like nuclease (RuvC/YqgF family)